MESKLETDGPAIGTKRDQFAYIFARLADGPQAMAAAYYELCKQTSNTEPSEFLQYLSSCYSDPNLSQRALDRLGSMTQGDKEPFSSFLPKFEKELADANGAGWASEVKIGYLKKTLNKEMRTELKSQRNMPKDYHEYVRALHDLGANLDEFRAFSRRYSPQQTARNEVQAKAPSPDVMDWEPTKISRMIQKQNKGLQGKRAKWVDQEELDRRRKEGRCFRCGRTNCSAAKCPLLPPKRPTQTTEVKAKKSKPVLNAVVDEDDVETDSSSYMTDGESEKE